MGIEHFRISKAGAHLHHNKRAIPISCTTGGFYKTPSRGQTVDSTYPLNITWDASCLTSTAVDIYLFAPGADKARIYEWRTIESALGGYNTTIKPKWWNSTSSMSLQLSIVAAGTPPFLSPFPAGPVITATYTAPASGVTPANADTSQPDSGVTIVGLAAEKKKAMSGRVAAGVLVPILILAIVAAAYFKWSRAKGKQERKRWSEAVDKRMSTIASDWKSITPAGAQAAVRNSMAVSGNRNSAFAFGDVRPESTFDAGNAGVGSRGFYNQDSGSQPAMSQVRPNARTSAYGDRVSRVSFAADPRPSGESRRNATSRAFHTSVAVPPLPKRSNSGSSESNGTMSPTQTNGPLTLTPEDIRARIAGEESQPRSSMDEVMPALSMMRNGGDGTHIRDNEYLFDAPETPMATDMPVPPTPTHPGLCKSPLGMMPMQPMPANVMSPDDMLRAYAERRAQAQGSLMFPPAAAGVQQGYGGNSNAMRTLYSPAGGQGAQLGHGATRYDDEDDDYSDAYAGTA